MLQAHLKNNFLTGKSVHAVHKTKSNLTLYILPSYTHLYTKQKGGCTAMYSLLFALCTLFIPRYITIWG